MSVINNNKVISKQKIMVDMDDVITSGGLLKLINEYLGTDYKEKDIKSFYMQDLVPNKDEFFKWFKNKNMYDDCHMNKDCYEVLKYLNEKYELYIGTSYIFKEILNESGYILNQKFEYLNNNLPFISPYQYIFLYNKNILDVDIKIDDKIENLENAKIKILYTAYHNKDISDDILSSKGIKRANNWQEIKNILTKE